MIVAIPRFLRTAEACRKKFETVFKQYKEDKLANSSLGNDQHKYKFNDSIDRCWNQASSVMKHVRVTTMDNTNIGEQKTAVNANDDVLQPVSTLQSEPTSA